MTVDDDEILLLCLLVTRRQEGGDKQDLRAYPEPTTGQTMKSGRGRQTLKIYDEEVEK